MSGAESADLCLNQMKLCMMVRPTIRTCPESVGDVPEFYVVLKETEAGAQRHSNDSDRVRCSFQSALTNAEHFTLLPADGKIFKYVPSRDI